LFAVVLYQIIITVMYYLAVRFKVMGKPFMMWCVFKVFVIAWNVLNMV